MMINEKFGTPIIFMVVLWVAEIIALIMSPLDSWGIIISIFCVAHMLNVQEKNSTSQRLDYIEDKMAEQFEGLDR